MTKRTKFIIFFSLIGFMIIYVGWVFYISEPKYINNLQNKELEQFDLVTIDYYGNHKETALVLQTDNEKALVVNKDNSWDDFYEIDLKKRNFRIVGKGTIYHKVNYYIGFNIMMVTQFIIIILIGILGYTTFHLGVNLFL